MAFRTTDWGARLQALNQKMAELPSILLYVDLQADYAALIDAIRQNDSNLFENFRDSIKRQNKKFQIPGLDDIIDNLETHSIHDFPKIVAAFKDLAGEITITDDSSPVTALNPENLERWHNVFSNLENYFVELCKKDSDKLIARKDDYNKMLAYIWNADLPNLKDTCAIAEKSYKGKGGKQRFASMIGSLRQIDSTNIHEARAALQKRVANKDQDFDTQLQALITRLISYKTTRQSQIDNPPKGLFAKKLDIKLTEDKIEIAQTLINELIGQPPKNKIADAIIQADLIHQAKCPTGHAAELGDLLTEFKNLLKDFHPITYTERKIVALDAKQQERKKI